MKNLLPILISFALVFTFANNSFAQSVYKVKYSSQADIKVFAVKYESQSDLKVYEVKY